MFEFTKKVKCLDLSDTSVLHSPRGYRDKIKLSDEGAHLAPNNGVLLESFATACREARPYK